MFRKSYVALIVTTVSLAVAWSSIPAAGSARHVSVKVPQAGSSSLLSAAPATGAFGLDLLRRLGRGNQVFSPDSIAVALSMAGTGARGQTAAQMARVLHLGSPSAFDAVGDLQSTIAEEQATAAHGSPEGPATLDITNGLFVQQGFALKPAFTAGLASHFATPAPQTVDFEDHPQAAVRAINAWVNQHTQGIIPHILESVSPEARLVLADAIYLHAAWLHIFSPRETKPGEFSGERGPVSVAFMHTTEGLLYGRGRGYAAVDLPYRSSTLSLLVLLPVDQSLTSLERQLTPARLTDIAGSLASRRVKLSLPRFHLAIQTELKRPLEALGMTDAFNRANFSGITQGEHLRIARVIHAGDFTVNEKGTVAAATTIVEAEGVSYRDLRRAVFDADHPFLFMLRDDHTGAVLFYGRLADPTPEARSPRAALARQRGQ